MRSTSTVTSLGCALLALGAADADAVDLATLEWSEDFAGERLSLDGYEMTFADDFDAPSVSDDFGAGPWRAPVHTDFGEATFDRPEHSNRTYTVHDGVLTLQATQDANGRWHGGNIQTVDPHGTGFAQRFGYFEARLRFPPGPGTWIGFWLKSQTEHWNRTISRPEIDVVEWYGGDPTGHHRTVHLWPAERAQFRTAGKLSEHWWLSNFSRHEGLAGEWHTYGALITPERVTIYVDGAEVGSFPALDEFKLPLYPLLSLTMHETDVAQAVGPIRLDVDYVRVYALSVSRE
jgi:beta-glucanase (GH16 family)